MACFSVQSNENPMPILVALTFCAILAPQDGTSRLVRELVEKLRSDGVEEREEAAERLGALGRSALPELQRATRDRDPEVAARAGDILRRIPGLEARARLRDPLSLMLGQWVTLELRWGSTISVKIIAACGDSVTVQASGESQSRELSLRDVKSSTVYLLVRDHVDRKNARVRFELAEWCLDHGLPAEGFIEYDHAAALDPELQDLCLRRKREKPQTCGEALLKEARELFSQKQYEETLAVLKTLLVLDENLPCRREGRKLEAEMAAALMKENEERRQKLQERSTVVREIPQRSRQLEEALEAWTRGGSLTLGRRRY